MGETKIQLNPNSIMGKGEKMDFISWWTRFFLPFNLKRSWLNLSALSQDDANRIRHLFSNWTLLHVKSYCIILTCDVLQHKTAQGVSSLINTLHGCWTMEVQPVSQRVNLQNPFILTDFFFHQSEFMFLKFRWYLWWQMCAEQSQQLQTLPPSNLLLVYIFIYI